MTSVRNGVLPVMLMLAFTALGTAHAQTDAEDDQAVVEAMAAAMQPPGPPLDVPADQLADALQCFDAQGAPRDNAVLLIHGTGLTARESWRRTYVPALTNDGYPTCTVKLPNRALDDAQISSEYAVFAIRRVNERFGDKINVVTHSQGALEARWAIKFFPDIRDRVDDLVMLSGSNHGTLVANVVCLQRLAGCTESVSQQRPRSRFLAALNEGDETPGDVDYTSVFSYTDEIVITRYGDPSPAIEGASNIAVQKLCKFRPVQHVAMITSSPVYAIVRDALDHEGAAELSRIDRREVCRRLVADDMQPISGLINVSTYLPAVASVFTSRGSAEPSLMPYAREALPAGDQSRSMRSSLASSGSSLRR